MKQEYKWKWDNYLKSKIDRMPMLIDLEPTTRCNYNCIMCIHSFNPPAPLDMKLDMAINIIDEFAEKGGLAIKFCYLGEPLLYPHLNFLIEYSKKKGILDTIVATNGSLLTKKKSKELIESGLDLLILSVDSCKREIYSKIRVGGNLDVVKKNLINLHNLKQAYKSKTPRIQIQAIRMEQNKEEMNSGEYEAFWKPYVDMIRINLNCSDFNNTKIIKKTPKFSCPSVFRRMTIRANGDISICSGKHDKNKIIGHFPEMSLEKAWNGKKFSIIRKHMKNHNSHLINFCETCSYRSFNALTFDAIYNKDLKNK